MTAFRGCSFFNAVEGWGFYSCPFSTFYFLAGRRLGGRSKAQEPSCDGAEDQAEAQRLPKMAARNTGGHQRVPQQQNGCPANPKKRPRKSPPTPGRVGPPEQPGQTAQVKGRAGTR